MNSIDELRFEPTDPYGLVALVFYHLFCVIVHVRVCPSGSSCVFITIGPLYDLNICLHVGELSLQETQAAFVLPFKSIGMGLLWRMNAEQDTQYGQEYMESGLLTSQNPER